MKYIIIKKISDFMSSSTVPIYKWQISCITEQQQIFLWDNKIPTSCPNNSTHVITDVLNVNHVAKYKNIICGPNIVPIDSFGFYRCDTTLNNGIVNLPAVALCNRVVIIQKYGQSNILTIQNDITPTTHVLNLHLSTLKFVFDGYVWTLGDLKDLETNLEPDVFTNLSLANSVDDTLKYIVYNPQTDNIDVSKDVNMTNKIIRNVANPVNSSDVATKQYVDTHISGNVGTNYLIRNILSTGTFGGTAVVNAWSICSFNTITGDDSNVTLVGNTIQLQAGFYVFAVKISFYKTKETKIRLFDVDTSSVIKTSVNYFIDKHGVVDTIAYFGINAPTNIRIEYFAKSQKPNVSLGYPHGISGEPEIFSEICIHKS